MPRFVKTCASLFERRGDPWVSPRSGREDFGRNLDTEDPDMDSFTRARKAPVKTEPPSAFPKKNQDPDDARRLANLRNQFHRKMNKIENRRRGK